MNSHRLSCNEPILCKAHFKCLITSHLCITTINILNCSTLYQLLINVYRQNGFLFVIETSFYDKSNCLSKILTLYTSYFLFAVLHLSLIIHTSILYDLSISRCPNANINCSLFLNFLPMMFPSFISHHCYHYCVSF